MKYDCTQSLIKISTPFRVIFMKRNKRISLLGECTNRKMNFLVSSFFYASLLEIKDRTSSTELELVLHISYTDLDCIEGQTWCSGESCLTESPGRGFETTSPQILRGEACLGFSLPQTLFMWEPPALGLPLDLDCIIGYIALLEQLRRFSSFIYGSVLEMRHY